MENELPLIRSHNFSGHTTVAIEPLFVTRGTNSESTRRSVKLVLHEQLFPLSPQMAQACMVSVELDGPSLALGDCCVTGVKITELFSCSFLGVNFCFEFFQFSKLALYLINLMLLRDDNLARRNLSVQI